MSVSSGRARALVLVVAALAGSALSAPLASASESQCPDGFSCVWTDADYQGSYSGRGNANYDEWHAVGGHVFNDSISSLKNRYPGTKVWFEHSNRGGARLEIGAGERRHNLQEQRTDLWYHADWNDFISSVD